jgi:predicted MFS family arabinose efflux permease
MNIWIDVALMASGFAIGNILFGHFEERTPKWRRVLKFFMFTALIAVISSTAGRAWSIGVVGALFCAVLIVHLWWLPKHGIHGFTGEPKEKYYALRGWKI